MPKSLVNMIILTKVIKRYYKKGQTILLNSMTESLTVVPKMPTALPLGLPLRHTAGGIRRKEDWMWHMQCVFRQCDK